MNDVELVRHLHEYNIWATERVLASCERLSPEQFTQADDTPWGSIRNQLVHIFIVHRRWLSWADGSMGGEAAYSLQVEPDDYPDIESVRAFWEAVNRQNDAFLARLTPETLDRVLSAESPHGSFSISTRDVMVHLAHHAMQHRSEVAMSLTRLGQSPGDVDFLYYVMDEA